MKRFTTLLLSLSLGLAACASNAPSRELLDARAAYIRASQSNAGRLVPAEVLAAKRALERAEYESSDDAESMKARDLAYIAMRKAQRAEALGNAAAANAAAVAMARDRARQKDAIIASQQGRLRTAEEELRAREAEIARKQAELAQTQGELTAQQQATKAELEAQQKAIEAERQARLAAEQKATEAEKKAQDAMDALGRQLAIREDARGKVITMSGSVLFATGKATLLPGARAQLDQVAEALKLQAEASFTIEGHTDDRGSDAVNRDLASRRANAVRDYLISRGVDASAVAALGVGESRPVADNRTTEGRAMNRRVEIVVGETNKSAAR